jgi:hypothetical protein
LATIEWDPKIEIVEGTHGANLSRPVPWRCFAYSFIQSSTSFFEFTVCSPLLLLLLLPFLSLLQMLNEYGEQPRDFPHPTQEQMDTVFALCRRDNWAAVLQRVHENPWIAMTPMTMDNHIATTILHQAITSKGNEAVRAEVILQILDRTPMAASIKNGYGSLPLHVISQRNTKMKAETKGKLIFAFVKAYKGALMEEGGVGKRNPLHIIFTGTTSNTNETKRND